MNSDNDSPAPRRLFWHRVKFLALIAVFLAPFIGGWLALYVFELRPESGNYGTLVQPVRKIDWPVMQAVDGTRHERGFGRKWTLLLFAGEACGEACRFALSACLLQSHDPAGGQRTRPVGRFQDGDQHGQFRLDDQGEVGAEPRLYLVDPDQNLMMHFPAQFDEERVLEDLRKLLKLSQIG